MVHHTISGVEYIYIYYICSFGFCGILSHTLYILIRTYFVTSEAFASRGSVQFRPLTTVSRHRAPSWSVLEAFVQLPMVIHKLYVKNAASPAVCSIESRRNGRRPGPSRPWRSVLAALPSEPWAMHLKGQKLWGR